LAIITISSLFSDRITQIKKGLKIIVMQIRTFFSIRMVLRTIPRSFREKKLFMGVFPLWLQPDNYIHLPFSIKKTTVAKSGGFLSFPVVFFLSQAIKVFLNVN